jgi:uncharacterized membrane protein
MLNIIYLLLTGSVFAYLAKDNLAPVTLSLANYTIPNIPLFFVIVGSLLVGLVLSYILQIVSNIANSFVLRGTRLEIKTGKNEILDLTKRIHQLELENEKLKHGEPQVLDANAL